jgi:hypothetical protein
VIAKYNGETGEEIGSLKYPGGNKFTDVAVTPDGGLIASWNIYQGFSGMLVDAKSSEKLVIFDPRGKAVKTLTNAVAENSDNLEMDVKVAADGQGTIYAAGRRAIFKFSPEGKFITRVGSGGDKRGQIGMVQDIAVDGQGRVYICDFNGILVYDKDGIFLGSIDEPGAESGIAVDDHNGVYFINRTKVYHYIMK